MTRINQEMESIYGKGKICRENGTCLLLEPDIENIMAESTNYSELLWAWKSWRDVVGREIRPLYSTYVDLKNEGARASGKFSTHNE